MKITVVRHGQTNYNVAGLHNADPSINVFLTTTGITEAKQAAKRLKNEPIDAIFVSEFLRTQQTADYINKYHNLPLTIDKRLNDIDTGFEGKPVSEYHAKRDTAPDAYTYRYGAFESPEDVYNRTLDFINYLKKQDFQDVLVVTGKHNFRHFRAIMDNLDPRALLTNDIPNAEILIREI